MIATAKATWKQGQSNGTMRHGNTPAQTFTFAHRFVRLLDHPESFLMGERGTSKHTDSSGTTRPQYDD